MALTNTRAGVCHSGESCCRISSSRRDSERPCSDTRGNRARAAACRLESIREGPTRRLSSATSTGETAFWSAAAATPPIATYAVRGVAMVNRTHIFGICTSADREFRPRSIRDRCRTSLCRTRRNRDSPPRIRGYSAMAEMRAKRTCLFVCPSTRTGKTLLAAIAALMSGAPISNVPIGSLLRTSISIG